ncbi:hypothetical protein LTR56_025286 [Elasticomyces elasticus]|nr:hypothetical protein LTR56_025286 [Elasticomyces elasticus]KAK3653766.1 hypothetical protein LTR22_010981 [Elasticomyces elasticus]KAK4901110.1 hypothetical protein LTR27_001666 [Elasticomyces elasticus]KAK4904988.1 hypothetical protein LTR49_025667 [Elasticomyces elasticus]KAK5682484.1 hypothetical protein LTS10_005612 [Elasticomyces elasticus]
MPQAPHSVPSPHAPDNNAHENVSDTDGMDPEKHPLPRQTSFFSRRSILGPVTKDYGDWPLLVCCLVTGLVDAASFKNWGMFVGMQTGNTVILGLSTAGLPANPYAWLTTLISIIAFLVGAFATFRVSKVVTPEGPNRNRLWASSLFMGQALLILLSAALATPFGLIPQEPGGMGRNDLPDPDVIHNIRIVSLIPPLAFQSGMQIATSRLLGFNELPVNVITSTYCDIMGDFKLMATNNVRRNRRVGAVVLLLIGSISSGWMLRSEGGLMSVLWLSGGLKFVTAVAYFCFVPAVKEELPKSME